MHAKAEADQPELIPFGYVIGDSNDIRGWAIISAPREQLEAIKEACDNSVLRGTPLDLESLMKAFNGVVTEYGEGPIPEAKRKDLHMLYGGREPEQGSLEL